MAVLKNRTQKDFTMISNRILRDQSLTMKERGVLCTVCGLPDGWNFTAAGLASIVPDGVDSISASIKSLEKKGYLEWKKVRTCGGKYASEIEDFTEPHGIIRDGKTDTDNPIRTDQDGSAVMENPGQYNTYNIKPKDNTYNHKSINHKKQQSDGEIDEGGSSDENGQSEANEIETYKKIIAENIKIDWLLESAQRHNDSEVMMVNEIYDVICDMVCYKRDHVTIKGCDYPWSVVKSQFLKLRHEHIADVLNRIVDAELGIKNMESYLISTLYSASLVGTIEAQAELHDDYLKMLRGKPYDV